MTIKCKQSKNNLLFNSLSMTYTFLLSTDKKIRSLFFCFVSYFHVFSLYLYSFQARDTSNMSRPLLEEKVELHRPMQTDVTALNNAAFVDYCETSQTMMKSDRSADRATRSDQRKIEKALQLQGPEVNRNITEQ